LDSPLSPAWSSCQEECSDAGAQRHNCIAGEKSGATSTIRKKITGKFFDPLMPEEMEKVIRETPRDAEVIELPRKTFRRVPPVALEQ
jgi:hypothetical protein